VGTAARIIAEQVKAGLIDEMYFEERFGADGKFPPIVHAADDGLTIRIEGRIDRLDVLRGGGAKVIDYKSGAESFSADEARSGWRLQLMLYLEAVTGARDASGARESDAGSADAGALSLKPAGAFYFKVSEPRIDCTLWPDDGETVAERAERALRRSFRLDGVFPDDQEVLRAIAGETFEEPYYTKGRSEIIPVRVDRDKETGEILLVKSSYNARGLLDGESFARLRGDVAQRVRACCEELAGGLIDARPLRSGAMNACTYCRYNGVCGYDVSFELAAR
jgi:ATP-dependent helicase/nuclease subunit B